MLEEYIRYCSSAVPPRRDGVENYTFIQSVPDTDHCRCGEAVGRVFQAKGREAAQARWQAAVAGEPAAGGTALVRVWMPGQKAILSCAQLRALRSRACFFGPEETYFALSGMGQEAAGAEAAVLFA